MNYSTLLHDRRLKALLPFLAAAFFCFWSRGGSAGFTEIITGIAGQGAGSFILAGIPHSAVNSHLPFLAIAASLVQNLGISPAALYLLLQFALYLLVYLAGSLLGGCRAGLAAMVISGLSGGHAYLGDAEQAVYSAFLLAALCLLLVRRRENTLPVNLWAGLAIGATLAVRSTLFIFPPLAALADWLASGRSAAAARRGLLFIAASYLLLVPWALLNRYSSGRLDFFESGRAGTNIISAALGSVYTMEGDARGLAGLDSSTSPTAFYFREAARSPFSYLLTTGRRLWHIFLFHPVLILLSAAAAVRLRWRGAAEVFLLPAYFAGIHALFSIEGRYFYPLVYILPPLIAGALLAGPGQAPAGYSALRRTALGAFGVCLAAVILLFDLPLLAYPRRAAANREAADTFRRASARFPGDKMFAARACREVWREGDDQGFYACLGRYSARSGDEAKLYFLAVKDSALPRAVPFPGCGGRSKLCLDLLVIRTLREVELGQEASAREGFVLAFSEYRRLYGILRGQPYSRDRQIAALLKKDDSAFYDSFVRDVLFLWPPAGMLKILSGMERTGRLGGKLEELKAELEYGLRLGGGHDGYARKWVTAELFGQMAELPSRDLFLRPPGGRDR